MSCASHTRCCAGAGQHGQISVQRVLALLFGAVIVAAMQAAMYECVGGVVYSGTGMSEPEL
jgi:hypothetical protein